VKTTVQNRNRIDSEQVTAVRMNTEDKSVSKEGNKYVYMALLNSKTRNFYQHLSTIKATESRQKKRVFSLGPILLTEYCKNLRRSAQYSLL